jgi:outer membrane protein OmpA-like peptidoglycan-associated protein
MKNRFWIALPLAAALTVPALAQQTSPSTQDQTSATSTQQTSQQAAADQQVNREPLKLETHEGFWGKLNPFARKKYVQRQLGPVTNRVNELDELTAKNSKDIKDVDSRAQEGIRQSMAKANEADQHAVQAGQTAQQAQQLAQQTGTRVDTVSQVVTNLDQYKPITNAEIRFRPGQTVLSKKAKDALDQMAGNLKDQRGYIVEIQGFSSGRGAAAIEQSQRMADAVRRYLVINSDVPVYRVHVLGMGNAPIKAEDGTTQRVRGARVEVSLLKNDLESLQASNGGAASMSNSSSAPAQGGVSGSAATSTTPAQQNNTQSQPSVSSPSQQQQPATSTPPPASTEKPSAAPTIPPPVH